MALRSKTPRTRRAEKRTARSTGNQPPLTDELSAGGAAPETPSLAPPDRADPKGKLGALVALLRRPEGAQIPDLMAASGWQAHSVRGALAGSLKVKHGLAITSTKTEAGRVYRIADVSAEGPDGATRNASEAAQA